MIQEVRQELWLFLAVSQGQLPGMLVLAACLWVLARCSAETCRAGVRPRECVAAQMTDLSCSNGRMLDPAGMGQGCYAQRLLTLRSSCVGSRSSCSKNCSSSLGEESKFVRVHAVSAVVMSGKLIRMLLAAFTGQCQWCLFRKGLWGRGNALTFCWCHWNARNPPASRLSAGRA